MSAFFHDWAERPDGLDACARCGGLAVFVGRNTECPVPPSPEPRPAAAQILDRALGESAFDRLDRLHKGRRP